ncbi:MAG TPA: T9SS type A sorting domain-containing protein [Bacteroidia bacterium]|nr:T9SS type A sorting domain-containing protein [Bacteroidia bacterium]
MKKITLAMFMCVLGLTGLHAQILSCSDLNGYVSSKNTSGTGNYTLQLGQEEKAAQTYHYSSSGKVASVRVYGNYPGLSSGVPLRVSISNVDANGRPTSAIQSSNVTWWWFNNAAGYITVNFSGGGVFVNNNFAVTVEVRSASPWGNSFMLQYTGNGEGNGEDLASLAGTSTGNNWTSAMTDFNRDGDFYLVPRMTNYITPDFNVSSPCNAVNTPVIFTNTSSMTMDEMFNTIALPSYSGTENFYSWDFGDASAVSHLANPAHSYATAGSYTVSLTCTIDGWNNDCSFSTSRVISVGLGLSATSTSVSCNGGSNGSITLTATGGAPAYTYQLGAGSYQAGNTFSGLTAGSYGLTVMDNVGCTANASVNITQPPAIIINPISSTNSSCGNNDGALLVTASGGTGALQYQLNSNAFQSSGSFTNLGSDFYTITVKDANGCTASNYGVVNDQGGPTLTITSTTNVSCNGSSNGSIVMNGTGGSGVLQYSINGGITWQTNGSFLNLAAGDYLCMVKDANGCSYSIKMTLTQPQPISFRVTTTPVNCNGDHDGSITAVNGIGGTGTYSYSLDNQSFQSSNVFNGLLAGTYTVYLRDIAGCTATQTATITQPTAIIASTSVINTGCNGSFDGAITVNATGGTAPYIYSTNGENFQSSNIFTDLESGVYNVVVRDANGCQSIVIATITQPSVISASITTGSSTCGNANGTMLVVGSGGTGFGYEYSIDGVNFNTGGSFSGLTSGTYDVVVRDANGCENVFEASIVDANGPTITSLSSTNASCNASDDGTITVNIVSGGTGTLHYSIGSTWQLSNSFTGLNAGTYDVLVQDANGCVGQDQVVITEPTAIVVTTTVTDVTCNGSATGSVTMNAAGGAGTLAYALDLEANFQSSNVFGNLPAGNYVAVVRDAAGCIGHSDFVIAEPSAIYVGVGILNEMCFGDNAGALYVNAAGGTGILTYSIDGINYQSSSTFIGLTAGTYTVYVKDGNGCVETTEATITQPSVLAVNSTVTNVICSGGNDGVIDLSVSHGTFPYTFEWSTGDDSEDLFNLTPGSYSVTVTDANGCQVTQSFVITQPANVLSVNGVIVDASTGTSADGGVNLTVTGGTGPYTFLWSNGQITQNLVDVPTGVYSVMVTDANGCVTSGLFFVGNFSGVDAVGVDASTISLYPNPATSNFTVEAGNQNIQKVEIIDMLGQVVYVEEPKAQKVQINTDGLSEGAYFVELYINGNRIVKRLQVSK